MVISSSKKLKINGRYHIRSVSLPSKSSPILLRLQQHLQNLNHQEQSSSSAAANKISVALSGAADLYALVDEALSLPHPLREPRTLVNDLLDGSLKLLDVCGSARDVVARLKESVRDLQSAIRRRKDEESVEELVSKYCSSRKEAIKNARVTLPGLKKVASSFEEAEGSLNDDVFGVRCVGVMSVSVYESLLTFLMTPPTCGAARRCGRWRVVASRLMVPQRKGGDEGENELSDVDAALHGLVCGGCGDKMGLDRYGVVLRKIEKLEMGLEGMENGLNALFRLLIKTRASLLNLLSF